MEYGDVLFKFCVTTVQQNSSNVHIRKLKWHSCINKCVFISVLHQVAVLLGYSPGSDVLYDDERSKRHDGLRNITEDVSQSIPRCITVKHNVVFLKNRAEWDYIKWKQSRAKDRALRHIASKSCWSRGTSVTTILLSDRKRLNPLQGLPLDARNGPCKLTFLCVRSW